MAPPPFAKPPPWSRIQTAFKQAVLHLMDHLQYPEHKFRPSPVWKPFCKIIFKRRLPGPHLQIPYRVTLSPEELVVQFPGNGGGLACVSPFVSVCETMVHAVLVPSNTTAVTASRVDTGKRYQWIGLEVWWKRGGYSAVQLHWTALSGFAIHI